MGRASPGTNSVGIPSRQSSKHVVCGKIVDGQKVVAAMEAVGSRTGTTSVDVVIGECGELK